MNTTEKRLVMPLLVTALFANFFLFAVTYTNASFSGYERALPDFGLSKVTYQLDKAINTSVDNFAWAVSTAYAEVKPDVVAFLGLDQYQYGMPKYTSLAPNHSYASIDTGTSQVLGISIVNPLFAQ